MRRRSAVEPVIGHIKNEHRMGRNYLAHTQGDAINAILAAAGYNFSLLLRWLKAFLWLLIAAFLNRPKQLATQRSRLFTVDGDASCRKSLVRTRPPSGCSSSERVRSMGELDRGPASPRGRTAGPTCVLRAADDSGLPTVRAAKSTDTRHSDARVSVERTRSFASHSVCWRRVRPCCWSTSSEHCCSHFTVALGPAVAAELTALAGGPGRGPATRTFHAAPASALLRRRHCQPRGR